MVLMVPTALLDHKDQQVLMVLTGLKFQELPDQYFSQVLMEK